MTYAEKLKHPKWQKKRLEILSRDGFKCVLCDDEEETLHVHHKIYKWDKQPWEYEDSNFQTVCEICHKGLESLKTADFLVPLKSFKVDTPIPGMRYLNIATKDTNLNVVTFQIFRLLDGEFTHRVACKQETIEKQLQFIKSLSDE